jgi:2-amino-4-hydroxy-6-hydroxymethyldihydropteridine diphosphokinase
MTPRTTVAFGLGSNLGDRSAHLAAAVERLLSLGAVREPRLSAIYETSPIGPEQPAYLNQVLVGMSDATPEALLSSLHAIEGALGRTRSAVRWGPRTIDIDLLALGAERRDGPDLVLPHPGIADRRFVLEPWAEVDPDFVVPGLGRSVAALLRELIARGDRHTVEPWRPALPRAGGGAR